MSDAEQLLAGGHALAAAQAFEHEGRLHEAAFAWSLGGAWEHAGRVLVQLRRMREAGFAYLRALPEQATPTSYLQDAQRHSALKAAGCLDRSGEPALAAAIFAALGEGQRAAELLRRAGSPKDAVRVARGRPVPRSPWPPGYLSSAPAASFGVAPPSGWRMPSSANPEAMQHTTHKHPEMQPPPRAEAPPAAAEPAPLPAFGAPPPPPAASDPASWSGPLAEPASVAGWDSNVGFQQASAPEAEVSETFSLVVEDESTGGMLAPMAPGGGLGAAPTGPRGTSELLADAVAARRGKRSRAEARRTRSGRTPEEEQSSIEEQVRTRTHKMGLGPVEPGSTIAARYRVEKALGEGGFAVVFQVMDTSLEERVALKLFRPDGGDGRALERFKREVRMARQLAHKNVVRTWEFGTWRNAHFITMELMKGADLHAYNDEVHWGEMPPAVALDLVAQALDGLSAAHELGIVHRDIKLRNLFVLDGLGFEPPDPPPEDPRDQLSPRLKVMDFGIAAGAGFDQGLTRTGMVVGTPGYVAPERLRREAGDPTPHVDIYAMGVVLYRLLCGRLPFHDRNIARLFRSIMTADCEPPSAHRPSLPVALDQLVAVLMAPDPAARPATAEAARGMVKAARASLRPKT